MRTRDRYPNPMMKRQVGVFILFTTKKTNRLFGTTDITAVFFQVPTAADTVLHQGMESWLLNAGTDHK